MEDRFQVCIQAEAGSFERRYYNEKTLEYLRTRQLSIPTPYAYGFILDTNADDDANLDCFIITQERLAAGSIVECEPIGLLEVREDGEVDDKVLATVPGETVALSPELHQKIKDFYTEAIFQVGRILPRQAACETIQASRASRK